MRNLSLRLVAHWAMAVAGLVAGTADPARAEETSASADQAEPPGPSDLGAEGGPENRIVVIGHRTIVAVLADAEVEQTYDEDRIRSYAVTSVQELLDAITAENGTDAPAVLVNGRPVSDIGDIADLPAEAVRRVEVLPQGTAARVGGPVGQRAVNVVLQLRVRSLTVTASRQDATEGQWSSNRGEVTATWVQGQDRANLTLRNWRDQPLLEADRGLMPANEFGAFSPAGNIVPFTGTEIDNQLSLLLGRPVTSLALDGSTPRPTLAALAPGANRVNPTDTQFFRTLRPRTKTSELSLSGAKTLSDWLTLTFNGRLSWYESVGLSGLPSGRFLISADNAFTPFSRPVVLLQSDPGRPLRSLSDTTSRSLSATLAATKGLWRSSLLGRVDRRAFTSGFDRLATASAGLVTLPADVNPFAGAAAGLLQIDQATSTGTNTTYELTHEIEGSLLAVPAGSVRLSMTQSIVHLAFSAFNSSSGDRRSAGRTEWLQKARVNIPLAAAGAGGAGIGAVDLSAEIGWLRADGRAIRHQALALNWQPAKRLRLSASTGRYGRMVPLELLSSPSFAYDNVRYFDPLTGTEALVTTLSGGSTGLADEVTRNRKLSLWAEIMPKDAGQLTVDLMDVLYRNRTGALPPPSAAVALAFPDRFVRDGTGRLVLVDSRTVNFDSQRTRSLRLGYTMNARLDQPAVPTGPRVAGARRDPPLFLNTNFSYTHVFSSVTTVRPGLDPVDLLDGGAIGVGGGAVRHTLTGSAALTRGGNGLRMTVQVQGKSTLLSGTAAAPQRFEFGRRATFGLRAFADLQPLLGGSRALKDTRLTVSADNLFGSRQSVTTTSGTLPTYFQPRYRDPIGRTVGIELRKVF